MTNFDIKNTETDFENKIELSHELLKLVSSNGSVRLINSLKFAASEGILDDVSIKKIYYDDISAINKLMRLPNFGAKTLSELKSLVGSHYACDQKAVESEFIENQLDKKYEQNLNSLTQFIDSDSAPNIPTKLSKVRINFSLLSADEQKTFKKIESHFGGMDLRSFFDLDKAMLKRVRGIGEKYLTSFYTIYELVHNEFFAIVNGLQKFDVNLKSLFITHDYFSLDFQDVDQILLDDVEEYLFSLDIQERELVIARWGFHCPSHTLEELAVRYGVTRERVRQRIQAINTGLLHALRISPDVLRENIERQGELDFPETLKKLSSCFQDERHFIAFLEIISRSKKGGLSEILYPLIPRQLIHSHFAVNISPIDIDTLAGDFESNYGYKKVVTANAIKNWSRDSIVKIVDGLVSPINLNKIEAAAHILLSHPNGLPWKDISKIINKNGCCSTVFDEGKMISSYLNDSEYVYLCERGTYKHLKFLDTSNIDIDLIMDDLLKYFVSNNVETINLHHFYQHSNSYKNKVDYYDLRQIIRTSCEGFGFFFDGKSGVDGLGITPNFSKVTQQKLILEVMSKAKGAITKGEIAAILRSKSINHASFYLDKMMDQGLVVRIDSMMYTTPEKAFKDIDTEKILQSIQNILLRTEKIVEADIFRMEINAELNLSYTKYFYAALASGNLQKYEWRRSHNLFSRGEILFQGMTNACSILCDPALSNSINLERIREEILVTKQTAEVVLNNWRASLNK